MAILDLQEALDLIEKGQAEEAISLLTTWTEQMPTYVAVHVVLARAYEAAEQWDKARASWHDAHFLMPNSPAVDDGRTRARLRADQLTPADENHLSMDLDLQAELEATLEALFNPFTLPQQAEPTIEEPFTPTKAKDEALAQAEAALAAAADFEDDEAGDPNRYEPAVETEEALPPEEIDATSIYDEIEQLIQEKERRKRQTDTHTPTPSLDDEDLVETVDEDAATTPLDVDATLDEEKQAIKALEAMVQEAADEDTPEDAEDWQDFEKKTEEDQAPKNKEFHDLERLISELESARIVPQPELEDLPPPDLSDDIEDMVSETLARIYASQGQYHEAARVYEQLALQHPDEADRFDQLAAEMRAHAEDSKP